MKIILEYRKEGSHWSSLTTGFVIPDNAEVKAAVFGYMLLFTLIYRDCPPTVSYATLTNLFKATTVGETEDGIPISNREWRINPSDVALLTVQEYEACLQGVENAVEYEAILAAATSLQHSLHNVRFFIFK